MFANSPYKGNRTAAHGIKTGILLALLGWFLILTEAGAQTAASVTLAWNPSTGTNIAGYHLHQGTSSGTYSTEINVGNFTNATVSGLTAGVTYYLAVSAYSTAGLESALSSEISYTPSSSTTSSPPTILLTAPSSGATYTAPATIGLAASVTPNGHTITKVQFYSGAALLGEVAAAPYAFSWNNVGAGSYSLTAKAVYDAGSTVTSSSVGVSVTTAVTTSPTPIPPPAPWQAVDIGNAGTTGNSVVSNGVFVVSGAGTISGTADSFRFVYQPLTGDGQITAQLSSLQNNAGNGCTGVMIRESLTPGSRYALMGLSTSDTFLWQRRNKTNFKTLSTTGTSGTPPQVWVRMVRSGSSFIGYESTDGVNWTQVSSSNISMASNIYIGLVVSSGSTSVLDTSSFSNPNVVP